MNIIRLLRRPCLSENQQPVGRATRFMKAKPDASRPALTGSKPSKVSRKNSGSMDTTASSEPNVTK